MIFDVVVVVAAFGIFGGVAWLTIRSQRKCLCCRRLFPNVAARHYHEKHAHQMRG